MPPSRKSRADHTSSEVPVKKRRKLTGNRRSDNLHQKPLSELFQQPKRSGHQAQDNLASAGKGKPSKQREPPPTPSISLSNSLEKMYSFPATRSPANRAIDLTSSSPPSPSSRRNAPIHEPARSTAFTPHQGSKKLEVKNRRTSRFDPEQYFAKVWSQLDAALTTIFCGERCNYSEVELASGVEHLSRQGRCPELYTRLRDRCESHLVHQVRQELAEKAPQTSNIEFLATYLEAWKKWNGKLSTLKSIFLYMDVTYLSRDANKSTIKEMGHMFFRTYIASDAVFGAKIVQGVMDVVDLDRRSVDDYRAADLLPKSIAMYHELGSYFSDFEASFIKISEDFFDHWAENEVAKGELSNYAHLSHKLHVREMDRCDLHGLDRHTRSELSRLFDVSVVQARHSFLTDEDSVLTLLEDNDAESLQKVYTLLQRIHKGADLGFSFNRYIREEGASLVFDEKREPEMVVRLLDFKKRLDFLHKHSFKRDEAIGKGLLQAFEYFINQSKKTQANWETDNVKPGEMIAKHVDLLLKGSVKAIPRLAPAPEETLRAVDEDDEDEKGADEDAEINHHLSLALDLFRFVHGKAVFEAFYKKDLARRLLMGRSASNDAERNMLARLKKECGANFTHNLESMFKDMDLARDEMVSYNRLQSDRGARRSGPDLTVSVLSSAAWPTYPDVTVTIPPFISKLISDFESHYHQNHSGRKLHWKHSLADCQLKATYAKGVRKEIVVSGFQALVLLLFNDLPDNTTALSYTDIRGATSLPDAELERTLQSLACAKYRVLVKHPKGREVHESDTFTYNASFTDPKTRIKINQIQLKETKEENKETHMRVAADRHYETQAAIVRIMKSRKTIGHAELVAEVIKATRTRGVLEPVDIKKNIDKLIDRDYMERTEGNNYAYVA